MLAPLHGHHGSRILSVITALGDRDGEDGGSVADGRKDCD